MSDPELPANPQKPTLLTRFTNYLRGLAFRVSVYLVIYFLIAFASIGPCFWWWFGAAYAGGPHWVERFYAPLLWLCDHNQLLSHLVNQYIKWWIS